MMGCDGRGDLTRRHDIRRTPTPSCFNDEAIDGSVYFSGLKLMPQRSVDELSRFGTIN
jgi:hypothetical protein